MAALQWDGLPAAPFEAHPEGSGLLRRAGLEAEAWRSWLVGQVAEYRAHRGLDRRPPALLWQGPETVGRALGELWPGYLLAIEAGKKQKVRKLLALTRDSNYWQLLRTYHDRLPPLLVLTVDYPRMVTHPCPPDGLVLGLGDFDRTRFEGALLEGAAALARA